MPHGVDSRAARLARFAAVAATAVLLLFALWEAWIVWPPALANPVVPPGMDFGIYLDRTRDWLAGDGFYRAHQLTGQPYTLLDGDAVYPPPALLLFLPWALGAPAVLWWLVPLGVIAASVARIRPPVWGWPLLAAVLVYPRTWTVLVLGNPSMWAIAFAVAGMAWGWPGVGAALKPVFAPFALLGLRRAPRRWLAAAGALAAVSLPFLPMWLDYATVLRYAQSPRGLEYTLGELPIGLLLAAGLSVRRGQPSPRSGAP